MAYSKDRSDSPMKRRGGRRRKKVCVFCGKENNEIDYKDVNKLKRYVSERGKILPRRITGNCAKHQRALTVAIKRSRHVAQKNHRKLRKTSESSDRSDQEIPSCGSDAVCSGVIF